MFPIVFLNITAETPLLRSDSAVIVQFSPDDQYAALVSPERLDSMERVECKGFCHPRTPANVSYRPGAFLEFCTTLGPRVVTEFNYRLSGRARAEIVVGFAIRSHDDAAQVAAQLRTRG